MALLVRGTRANGNTRGLLIAGIPEHNGAELMTRVVTVHGGDATGNTVMLVPCSISGTLGRMWGGGGGRTCMENGV